MKLTKDQLDILRHMLGINTPWDRAPKPNRNYAAVTPGDSEFVELEQLGVVEKYRAIIAGEYDWYRCTEEGKLAAMRSHKDIRYKKSQRRYAAYLDMADVFPDLTFKDFLTHPDFKEARDGA